MNKNKSQAAVKKRSLQSLKRKRKKAEVRRNNTEAAQGVAAKFKDRMKRTI